MALLAFLGGFVALRTGLVERREIPHEAGSWMEFRLLGWKDLDDARRARQDDAFDSMRKMGKELYQMLQDGRPEDTATAVDPLAAYDLETVLRLGIAAWSYDDPVSEVTIRFLDPVTAEWAARVIVNAEPETEAVRKNGSGRSTTP